MELVRSRDRWQHVIWKEHRVLHPVRDAKPEPWILTILLVELASSDSLSKYQDLGWPILQGFILVSSLLWIWPSAIKCFSFWPPNEWAGPVTVDNSPEEPRTDFCRWKLRAALKTLKDILAKTEILSLSFHRFPQPLLGCRSWCTSGVVFWRNWAMVSWVAQSHSWDSDGLCAAAGSAPSSGERCRRLSRPFLTWAVSVLAQLYSGFLCAAHCPQIQRVWEFKGGEKTNREMRNGWRKRAKYFWSSATSAHSAESAGHSPVWAVFGKMAHLCLIIKGVILCYLLH